PPEMAPVGEVCVDRWEASLVEALPGGEERPWSPFRIVPGAADAPGLRLRAVSRAGVLPQGYVSGREAAAACSAAGKRLCTAREWEMACRGPRQTTFPYGATRIPKACNDDGRKLHPVAEASERLGLPAGRMWYEGLQSPLINQLRSTLRRTGERAGCTNDFGTYDMVGNLHEWIDDPSGTFRGGYYLDTSRNGDGCDYATSAHSFGYHDYSTGFRCCMDAEPVE
ncbi:MAG: SUMF1/EgtB/PvdO family nonheme iron enzyme, partial [Deltaproteobacteria bacterium]|nr:SUMF1/EgtB/PvdO family nonheme iron enzyme [Deltaproteobacteria bacterium]